MDGKHVAAGIILNDRKVLIAQRKRGKQLELYWELPGGKVEENETLDQCLKRELMEEMGLEIDVKEPFVTTYFSNEFGIFIIHAVFAKCSSMAIPKLCDHETYKWVSPKEALSYKLAPADSEIMTYLSKLEENYLDLN